MSDVGILLRQQFGHGHFAGRVVQHGQAEEAGRVAHFAADARVQAVRLDADKAVALDGRAQQVHDAAPVAPRMHEGKAVKTLGIGSDQARHAVVGNRVIGVKGGEQHAAGDAGPPARGADKQLAAHRCPTARSSRRRAPHGNDYR